jgi:hypothetical protein
MVLEALLPACISVLYALLSRFALPLLVDDFACAVPVVAASATASLLDRTKASNRASFPELAQPRWALSTLE